MPFSSSPLRPQYSSSDVRQVLESLILSLSLLIGDDTKVVREAQMMHTILGKGDIAGPSSSNTDIVTFGLELRYLASSQLHTSLFF